MSKALPLGLGLVILWAAGVGCLIDQVEFDPSAPAVVSLLLPLGSSPVVSFQSAQHEDLCSRDEDEMVSLDGCRAFVQVSIHAPQGGAKLAQGEAGVRAGQQEGGDGEHGDEVEITLELKPGSGRVVDAIAYKMEHDHDGWPVGVAYAPEAPQEIDLHPGQHHQLDLELVPLPTSQVDLVVTIGSEIDVLSVAPVDLEFQAVLPAVRLEAGDEDNNIDDPAVLVIGVDSLPQGRLIRFDFVLSDGSQISAPAEGFVAEGATQQLQLNLH